MKRPFFLTLLIGMACTNMWAQGEMGNLKHKKRNEVSKTTGSQQQKQPAIVAISSLHSGIVDSNNVITPHDSAWVEERLKEQKVKNNK